jgi:hypothetical protein
MKTKTLYNLKNPQISEVTDGPRICNTCLFDSSIAYIHEDGECEYCKLQTQQREQAREPWEKVLARIKKKGKGRKYDCLIGISGGEDSSVLLYLAVKVWNLRVLVLHINNRTNRPQATNNIQILRDKLNINFIEYFPAKDEYDELTDSLLRAGVPDADCANDIHMSKLTWDYAKHNGIKCTLNGHSFREEGSSPKAWSFLDTTYMKDIYKKFTGKDLYYYETLSVWDQVHSAMSGMLRVSPYHYDTHNRPAVLEILKGWGWQSYGSKHNENIYTAWVGCNLLPNKFGIDKRRTYLSAAIREGKMTKEYAKEILATPMEFDLNDLGERKAHILHLADSSPLNMERVGYKKTNYKKLKAIFWVLAKLKIVPQSMYNKYVK